MNKLAPSFFNLFSFLFGTADRDERRLRFHTDALFFRADRDDEAEAWITFFGTNRLDQAKGVLITQIQPQEA